MIPSPADLTMMQNAVAPMQATPCVIARPVGGVWTVVSAGGLLCRVSADRREEAVSGAPGTERMRRWRITLPVGTDVRINDRLTALGIVYGVMEVLAPTSNLISVTLYAYALWTVDGSGNPGPPLYLRFNAKLSTQRDGVTGNVLTAIDALIEAGKLSWSPTGPERVQTVLIGPNQNVLPGDYLTGAYYSGLVLTGKATFVDEVENGDIRYMTLTVVGGLLPP